MTSDPAPSRHPLALLDRALMGLYAVGGYLAAALLVCLALLFLVSIIGRAMGTYIPGLNAYAGYVLAGCSFMAFAYAFRDGAHIRVGILITRLGGRAEFLVRLWCQLAAAVITCYVAWYVIRMTWESWLLEDVSEEIDATPLWIPQSVLAAGSILLALVVVHHVVRLLAGMKSDAERLGEEA